MTHEELEDAIPLYAIGALERGERQAIEAHLLSGCVSCHGALREFQSVAVALPFVLNIVTPPRLLKAKIMAARMSGGGQNTTAQPSGTPSLGPGEWMNHLFPPKTPSYTASLGWVIAVAAAALIAGGGYMAWTAYDTRVTEDTTQLAQLQDQAASADSRLAALQQQLDERDTSLAQAREELRRGLSDIAELKDQLIQREAELDVLKAQLGQQARPRTRAPQDELAALLLVPNATAVTLAGTEIATRAGGVLLYDPQTQKAWLYALNLPECPTGMDYQLWALHEKPVGIGTFHIGKGETSHIFVKPVPNFTNAKAFSVSLEPSGGRPQPTGPLYLLSRS